MKILNENFKVLDTKHRITIADSFVVPKNKTESGNGEAKLYVGQDNIETRKFFGDKGFENNCFFLRKDLIQFLKDLEIEYVNPTELGNTQSSVQHYLDIFGIGSSEKFKILEDVFSGPGISRVAHELIGENLSGEEILQRAQTEDKQCINLIERYIKCFAILSSEAALLYNCHGGIFIAGSFIRGLEKYFDLDSFTNDFIGARKHIHQDFLSNIPVFLVKKEFTPLYGNLNYYQSKKKNPIL